MAIVIEPLQNGPYLVKNLESLTNSKGAVLPTKGVPATGSRSTTIRGSCAQIGRCTDNLAAVFRLGEEPWIDPGATPADEIAAVVRMCPSGALSYSLGPVEHRDQDRAPAVFVSENGPYYVTGRIELLGAPWGEGTSREHYALCRCGQSRNKPFCDGSHWDADFRDEAN